MTNQKSFLKMIALAGVVSFGMTYSYAEADAVKETPRPQWTAESHFRMRMEKFKKAVADLPKETTGTVVLVGDSITEHFNIRHKLPETLGGLPVIDQGISGDQVDKAETKIGVTNRVDIIKAAKPKIVFLHIGTNDFWGGKETPEQVIPQYKEMLHRIRKEMPGVKVVVQSIIPGGKDKTFINDNVSRFNEKLPELAKEINADFLDLAKEMRDEKGELKEAFTDDGIHLLPPAYELWAKILDEKVKSLQKEEAEYLKYIHQEREFKKKEDKDLSHYERIYQRIEKEVEALPADTTATIVLTGDSITQGYDSTKLLDEKLRGLKVMNHGIGGDIVFHKGSISYGLNNRVNLIGKSKPEVVFILIGVNDINGKTCTPEEYIERYRNLVEDILLVAPQTKIVVQTIMPVEAKFPFPECNKQVVERNALLKEFAKTYGFSVLDTYELMKDENGELKKEYSSDGIHLTPVAYEVWFDAIKKHKY